MRFKCCSKTKSNSNAQERLENQIDREELEELELKRSLVHVK
jgi:hypothetical protein